MLTLILATPLIIWIEGVIVINTYLRYNCLNMTKVLMKVVIFIYNLKYRTGW